MLNLGYPADISYMEYHFSLPLKPGQREELSHAHIHEVCLSMFEGAVDDYPEDLLALSRALQALRRFGWSAQSTEFAVDVDWEEPEDVPHDLLDSYGGEVWMFYDNELSAAPGTKVGGWGHWVHSPDMEACPRCGNPMELLLTLGSREYINGERWSAFYEGKDELLEHLDPDPRKGPGCWTGLALLDTAYFHYCTACEDRPVRMTTQAS